RVRGVDDYDARRRAIAVVAACAARHRRRGAHGDDDDPRLHRGYLSPPSSSGPRAAGAPPGAVFISAVLSTIGGSPASFSVALIDGRAASAARIACSWRSSWADKSSNTVYDWAVGLASLPPTTPASAAIL